MNRILATLAVVMALGLASCDLVDCVDGSGTVAVETRSVGDFHSIKTVGSTEVIVTQGATRSLRVETDDNILPLITTVVTNSVLVVDTKSCFSSDRRVRVHVTMPAVRELRLSGSGTITATTPIAADTLRLVIGGSGSIALTVASKNLSSTITGSGKISLSGTATNHAIVIDGSGSVMAENLATDVCSAVIEGSGNARVAAASTLNVNISGSGSVYYRGNPPTINSSISGSGKLTKLN